MKTKNIVFLPTGAYKLDRKGNPVSVPAIVAQEPNDCCGIDCCKNVIKFVDSDGVQREISLEALYLSTLEVATSVSLSGCPGGMLTTDPAETITATILPSTAPQSGTWVSSTPSVATVNSSGLVTPVAAGTTTITFTASTGTASATCLVTVTLP